MSRSQHALSFMLPITVAIIFPSLLMYTELAFSPWFVWPPVFDMLRFLISGIIISIGLILLGGTIRLFAKKGEGTLSPLHPTKKLVVVGVYRYVRNPMITGVLTILLGESIFFLSIYVFGLFLFFSVGNHVYFIKSEEPGLVKRFGEEYLLYKENVPRWIPRRTPWSPPLLSDDDRVS